MAGMYRVTARQFATGGMCTDPGDPTAPAVPDFQLAAMGDELAWAWCDSPTQCDPIHSIDYFAPDGDHFTKIDASVHNAPDNGTACTLSYDTLAVHRMGTLVHVDLLNRGTVGDVANCTVDQAIAKLANDAYCSGIDRYDLAPL